MASKTTENFMLSDEDALKVRDIIQRNEESVNYFNEIADGIVDKYCKFIEDLMEEVKIKVSNINNPITDDELDYYILKMPNALFFAGEAVCALGVKKDMAKADRLATYNKAHLVASGTVSDKDAKASSESKYESIIENIFDRACRKVQQRIEAGWEMVSSMKKVLSRRMMAYQYSGVQSGRIAPQNGFNNYKDREDN